ncbi:MAG: hypothetical protein OXI43_02915 [Candidatus Poribacteria bacterium]|nr:hypothetical protein [Candidatus Poribacteria bacterium]
MQSTHGITALAFRMKFFKLLLLTALSAIIFTGCERRLVSPIDPIDQTTAQFAQKALSDLADTAAERGFVDLANAANEVAEVLAIEIGTTTETPFWKLFLEANALQQGFSLANCGIKLGGFAIASERAARAYATEAAVELSDREQVLENLAQEALNAEKALQQFPTENAFIPFAFGYDRPPFLSSSSFGCNNGVRIIYDETIRPMNITRAAVVEFLTLKGYAIVVQMFIPFFNEEGIVLNAPINIMREELYAIPGLAEVSSCRIDPISRMPSTFSELSGYMESQLFSFFIIDRVGTRYNVAWCQGNFDVIDSILIEESGLDFFNYTFVRDLADIYAEEIPEAAERIRTNGFSLHSIAVVFLHIYFQHSEKNHEEVNELYRQSIRDGYVTVEHLKIRDPSRSSDWTVSSE